MRTRFPNVTCLLSKSLLLFYFCIVTVLLWAVLSKAVTSMVSELVFLLPASATGTWVMHLETSTPSLSLPESRSPWPPVHGLPSWCSPHHASSVTCHEPCTCSGVCVVLWTRSLWIMVMLCFHYTFCPGCIFLLSAGANIALILAPIQVQPQFCILSFTVILGFHFFPILTLSQKVLHCPLWASPLTGSCWDLFLDQPGCELGGF